MSFSHAFKLALPIVLSLGTSALFAQSLSVDDLKAKIDAEMNKSNEYAELLNDPDPARAQMAMKMMLESGDPALVKIALEYGLYSPDASVRGQAVKAFFDSFPTVEILIDASSVRELGNIPRDISHKYNSGLNAENKAIIIRSIIGYDEKANCYTAEYEHSGDIGCYFRIFDGQFQFYSINRNWFQMSLTDAGVLVSDANIDRKTVRVEVPIK